jgi:hypothetical protein
MREKAKECANDDCRTLFMSDDQLVCAKCRLPLRDALREIKDHPDFESGDFIESVPTVDQVLGGTESK